MKKTLLSLAITSLLSSSIASAMTVEERLAAMEQRIMQLENRVATQDAVIREKESQIEELQQSSEKQAASSESSGSWFDNVEIGGVIEVEANSVRADGGDDTSDIYVATAELDISAEINPWTTADLVLLYEDGYNGVEIDTATISIADPDNIWYVTAGKTVVPFGIFAANTLSDPLTLELAETSEDTLIAGLASNGWNGGVYTYAGDTDDNVDDSNLDIGSYGAYLGYARETDSLAYDVSVGYTNNLGDSDTISDGRTLTQHVDAWYASLGLVSGAFGLNAEYIAATDDFAVGTLHDGSVNRVSPKASPSAYYIEGSWNFSLAEKSSVFAIGYSATDEAEDIGLAEKRLAAALSIGILENTYLTFEYANEEAYTGEDTDTVTGQLAVEF